MITFHGGMVAIAYEWGSLNHNTPKDKCPDDIIHEQQAIDMSLYAGSFGGSRRLVSIGGFNGFNDVSGSDSDVDNGGDSGSDSTSTVDANVDTVSKESKRLLRSRNMEMDMESKSKSELNDHSDSDSHRKLARRDGYPYPYGRMNGLVYGVNGGMEVCIYVLVYIVCVYCVYMSVCCVYVVIYML